MAAAILRPLWAFVFAIAIAVLHVGVPAEAHAAQNCNTRSAAIDYLKTKHNEEQVATAQSPDGRPLLFFMSPSGSFSVLLMTSRDTVCLVMSGTELAFRRLSRLGKGT